nr:methyl-CpG-binding domain-containing protein 2-like isoform X1 [Tanacetum cinerariifolium]
MKMSNMIIEDLLARCLKIKEIIDASIARIDSIRNDKAEEETSAKEAKESSYEGTDNTIGKENGSKKEKNKQPKVRPTRVEPKPQRHNRMVKAKFMAARGTNRTHKFALASDFQEGLIRPLIFWENSQNNTMATTITTWCPQKGINEEHGIREFKIIQSNTLRTRVYKYIPMRPWTTKLPITVNGGIQQTASSTILSYQDCVKEELRATISAMNEYFQHNINGLTFHMSLNNINQNDIDENEDNPSCDDSDKQQVLYDPSVHGGGEIESCPDPISSIYVVLILSIPSPIRWSTVTVYVILIDVV